MARATIQYPRYITRIIGHQFTCVHVCSGRWSALQTGNDPAETEPEADLAPANVRRRSSRQGTGGRSGVSQPLCVDEHAEMGIIIVKENSTQMLKYEFRKEDFAVEAGPSSSPYGFRSIVTRNRDHFPNGCSAMAIRLNAGCIGACEFVELEYG